MRPLVPKGFLSVRQIGIGHAFDLEHFQVINARIPQITATPMHTAFAILLKSKKPLPVTVIAQAIAKMVMRAKTILITFRMILFFTQLHPKSIFFRCRCEERTYPHKTADEE